MFADEKRSALSFLDLNFASNISQQWGRCDIKY